MPVFAKDDLAISQEEAIEKVKELFDTSIYDNFNININYDEILNTKTWELVWSQSKEPFKSLDVSIDAKRGNILRIYNYKGYDPYKKTSKIPKISEDEAIKIAKDFASKIQPQEFSNTKYLERGNLHPIEPLKYQKNYTFNFVRIYQDIPVENDGFNITIDADTGDIESYTFRWDYDKLPLAENLISKKEAEKIFKDKIGLKLRYKRYFDPKTKNDQIKLVYVIEDPHNTFIDAKTGSIIHNNYNYRVEAEESAADKISFLTPIEQREVDISKKCITKNDALNVIKKHIKIPQDYVQSYANLYEEYDDPSQKVWEISWERNTKDKYGVIHARVDALNSELLSFQFFNDDLDKKEFEQKYNKDDAKKIAEDFIKELQPERFDKVVLKQTKNPEKVREHSFTFIRYINDIPYPENGFNIVVDAAKGDIISYKMCWQDRVFPEATNILPKLKAEDEFLLDIGLELAFVNIYDFKNAVDKYHLVYKLKPSKSYTFDATNLKPLDSQGKPIKKEQKKVFDDIEHHWAKDDIQLLVDLGIISPTSNKFNPDENIKQGEFIKLLLALDHNTIENDQEYIDIAIKMGLVKPNEINTNSPISREKAMAFLVRALGYEKVAKLDIFHLTAKDKNLINPDYKGHLAIALGFGIITEDMGKVNPKDPISNAEAATILVRMLKLDE